VAKKFSLGKSERLKSRKLIEKLFSEGKSFVVLPYRIHYLLTDKGSSIQYPTFNIQFGIGVSGKNFKKAVERNGIKRVTREAYRLQKNGLQETLRANNRQLNLFFIYTAKELPDFNTVKEKVKLILGKLIKTIDENNSSNS
jgi:ribonuclease P protein component